MYQLIFVHVMYSLSVNNIGTAGIQSLAEGLQHCTNLQELE